MQMNNSREKEQKISVWDVVSKICFWLFWTIMIVYVVSLLILPIFMILTSFKADNMECVFNPFGLPKQLKFENYTKIFEVLQEKLKFSVGGMFAVSLSTAIFKPLLGVLFTTLFAYVEAKYNFVGRKFFFNLGIVLMIIPIVGNMASSMQVQKALGVYNNLFLNIITSCGGCFYGTNFLLMYAAFKALPWDYAESVFIDGGGHYTVLFKIYLPMALPSAVVLFVLGFMGAWNDYSTFMIWLPDYPNIAYGMYLFNLRANQLRVSLPQIMAGFTTVMIPTVLLYMGTQGIIRSKFMVGGLKG